MEKQLKCVLMLSLKEMALRKVTILLWSGSDISISISKFQLHELYTKDTTKEWRETIEDKIKEKVLKLKLPKILQEQMLNIVEPIGAKIRRWRMSVPVFVEYAHKEDRLPELAKLCFTTAGAVDYKKSAEELVRWKKLNVIKRYEIACIYCLEDYIPLLWEELPTQEKWFYSSNKDFRPDLLFCWPRILKGELSKLHGLLNLSNRNLTSFNQWAFERSAKNGNKTAAEYFFLKLTHEEREASLVRTAHAVLEKSTAHYKSEKRPYDILCYLLCLMTPEQQMETIKAHPVHVLLPFFGWPLQDLLVPNANLIWPFVPPSGYGDLLRRMADVCANSFYFPKVLKEFFMQSPLDFKKYFVHEISGSEFTPAYPFLRIFFDSDDTESIEVMFRSLDATDRVKLVFYHGLLFHFYRAIMMQKWHMVEVCLREADLSKEDRKRLKRRFLKCDFIRPYAWGNGTFIRFLEFLDEADASAEIEKNRSEAQARNLVSREIARHLARRFTEINILTSWR